MGLNQTGKLIGVCLDMKDSKQLLTFKINDTASADLLDRLMTTDVLDIKAIRHSRKRSLKSNAYYQVLKGKIAEAMGYSRPYVHNLLLRRYGQLEYYRKRPVELLIRDSMDVDEWEFIHLTPTSKTKMSVDGELYRIYLLMRGSHTFTTKEMSRLIEGTVSEARQLGIETAPPDQKQKDQDSRTVDGGEWP